MKYSVLAFAILTISATTNAQAADIGPGFGARYGKGADNESPIVGRGAISVVRNEPAASPKRGDHTVAEINNALDFFGRPNLGTSRILHSDKARESESTKTYTESTITYHSGNK